MKQYLITGMDGTDESALERRMSVRPLHFEKAKALKASGNFVLGGAILDDAGKMKGSMMVVQFESDAALKAWMAEEPYILGQVWQQIEVKPFKVADV
ncbi:YciI family protein [Terrimonas sp. NA20]|uniref:YciI family protein n=1 Tax=Terrimonas ginsenosidimutans TaxID=2908004 RepID=A0ABS9KZ51_9BACT|nr:YciI family protein [Terrimonas ginsenosidimutans]MCG2617669.1 YciI family protein [Terrimonas ginsenosidimutans]